MTESVNSEPRRDRPGGWLGLENQMVLVTSLIVAFVMMDRLAVGFIAPYLIADLNVSVTNVGLLYSVQAMATAVSGILLGRYADRTGKRKTLVASLLALAALIALVVLVVDQYVQLVLLRLLMGLLVGGLTPVIQSIVSIQSTPDRLGRNLGVQMLLLFLIGQMAGPLVTTSVAEAFGWRVSYAAFGFPFVIMAGFVLWSIRDVQPQSPANQTTATEAPAGSSDNLTIAAAMVISAGFMTCMVIHTTFLSLYLVDVQGVTPVSAGRMISILGIAGAVGGVLIPVLSGKLGPRLTLALAMALMSLIPLAALFWSGSVWGLQVFLFLGGLSMGALPIYSVLLPREASSPARIAANIALVIAVGEVIGGIGGPLLAGQMADQFGLRGPFVLTCGTAVVCLLISLLLLRRGRGGKRAALAA